MAVNTKSKQTNVNCSLYRFVTSLAVRIISSAPNYKLVLIVRI